jgi:hypothetical protein
MTYNEAAIKKTKVVFLQEAVRDMAQGFRLRGKFHNYEADANHPCP